MKCNVAVIPGDGIGPDIVAEAIKVLKTIGEKYGKSVAQIILRWLVQRGIVPLAKTVSKERMLQNIDIFNFKLNEDDMKKIAALDKKESSFFNHQEASSIEMLANLIR